MIATINGKDTVKTLATGQYRAHRMAAFWIGDYATFADAERALQIANSTFAEVDQRGVYDGGVHATEAAHVDAVENIFGVYNRVSVDDVRRTILAGESCRLQCGFPVRA